MAVKLVDRSPQAAKLNPALQRRPRSVCARSSPRWQRINNLGGRPQRLLFASTGTKDPHASDILYVRSLAAPFTVNTLPEHTLKALAEHADIDAPIPADGGDCEKVLAEFARTGIDIDALAARLQEEGAAAFTKSWNALMHVIDTKGAALQRTG
jgi:transaldolase